MPDKTDAELEAERGEAAAAEAKAKAERDKQGDEVVPKRQLIAAVNSAERKTEAEKARADALQAQLNEMLAGKKGDQPKQYTRGELNAAVQSGQITQEAADQVWEDQIVARAEARATQVSLENVVRAQRKERVDSDISRYTALEPDILVEGSEIRNKVAKEFKFFIDLGDPRTPDTELKAIRAALGPIDQLELAKSGTSHYDTHRETGDSGGSGRKAKKFEDMLSPRERAYYQKGIDSKRYKDWDEVKKEVSFANPNTRRKHGVAV